MTKTKNDVILSALRYLTVIAPDEPAQAEDIAYAGDVYDGVYAEMFYTQKLDLGDPDEVPDEQFIPTYKILAADIAPHFSLVGPRRSQAIMALRSALARTPVETAVQADYF